MLLGAYYYAWYKNNWLSQTKRASCPPLLGEYDNTIYSDVILTHMKQAKDAGIDFLSVSWEHRQDHWHIIDAAEKIGIKITFLYESLTRVGKKGDLSEEELSNIMTDMASISEYMDSTSWLKINGKPVIMIYVTRAYRGNLRDIFSKVRSAFGREVFLVGDHLFWKDLKNEGALTNFDAVTYYNMYQKGRFEPGPAAGASYISTAKDQLTHHMEACKRFNVPLWGSAMPGYDDTGVRPDREHPPIDRRAGEFFRQSLEEAKRLSYNQQAMMITSFNEWYEDTQIEPCSDYGTKYLEILKEFKK